MKCSKCGSKNVVITNHHLGYTITCMDCGHEKFLRIKKK